MDWESARDTLLRELVARERIGVVTDVDGTISPIMPTPAEAAVTPRNREMLAALHDCVALVAAVSGRGVTDLHERVGLPQLTYVGNHGLERWVEGQADVVPEVALYRPHLEAALDEVRALLQPGLWIEDKGATASVHYRQAADPDAAQAQLAPIIRELAERHRLKFSEGRRVFELRPPIEIDKGTAFRRLIEDFRLDGAIFIGDDMTDVDAMRAARDLRERGLCYALGVGVDSSGTPDLVREVADVLVPGVPGVEVLLGWLFSARCASAI